MNGIQLERVLNLIDNNIHSNMESVQAEVLRYLQDHADELAEQISNNGFGIIQTHIGNVTVSKSDIEAIYA